MDKVWYLPLFLGSAILFPGGAEGSTLNPRYYVQDSLLMMIDGEYNFYRHGLIFSVR